MVSIIAETHPIIIAVDSIITGTPTATVVSEIRTITVDSETKTRVTRTIRETKTIAVSEIRTVTADSGTKTAAPRAIREARTIAVSGITRATEQNHRPAGSEIIQATRAVIPTGRAANGALDKTIINKETNS